MMLNTSDGISLWEKAKKIEQSLPQKRENIYKEILKLDPSIKYKNFGGLVSRLRYNKLPYEITKILQKAVEEIEALKNEAEYLRDESNRLIQEKIKNDNRKSLDPKIDSIPFGEYPKFTKCDIYPLRNSCNYGEDQNSKWDRCEYMKYDDTKSIFDSSRWKCIYTKDL